MGRPEKKNLGAMPCICCGEPAAVRRMESRKEVPSRRGRYVGTYYLFCKGCGTVQAPGASAQARILREAQWHEGCAPEAPSTPPPPAEKPAAARAPSSPSAPKPPAAPVKKPGGFDLW